MGSELKEYFLEIPKANRDRLFKYDWTSKGGFQTRCKWLLDQLDPPWGGGNLRSADDPKRDNYDPKRKVYRVAVTRDGIGPLLADMFEHGGFVDLFRKEVWPIIADYIDNPPRRK